MLRGINTSLGWSAPLCLTSDVDKGFKWYLVIVTAVLGVSTTRSNFGSPVPDSTRGPFVLTSQALHVIFKTCHDHPSLRWDSLDALSPFPAFCTPVFFSSASTACLHMSRRTTTTPNEFENLSLFRLHQEWQVVSILPSCSDGASTLMKCSSALSALSSSPDLAGRSVPGVSGAYRGLKGENTSSSPSALCPCSTHTTTVNLNLIFLRNNQPQVVQDEVR